jgi:hypothetical protein
MELFILAIITLILIFSYCWCNKELFGNQEFKLTNQNRLEYYLNGLTQPIKIKKSDIPSGHQFHLLDKSNIGKEASKPYFSELNHYYKGLGKPFVFRFGDTIQSFRIPIITKSRPVGKNLNVLLKLDIGIHYSPLEYKRFDIPFKDKKPIVLWRGNTTGFRKRYPLVLNYQNSPNSKIDVGFVNISKNKESRSFTDKIDIKLKKRMEIPEMLKYKYLVSMEGVDVGTNLKWILNSNSVCFKVKETEYVSWFMEDTLVPWVHYIPLNSDYSDLTNKLEWAENNQDKCLKIIKNANERVKPFLDSKNEYYLNREVLKRYLELVTINY